MKVAIVLNTSWNIYNFRLGLLKALQLNGHEVITIAPNDAYSDELKKLGCKHIDLKMDSRGANPLKDLLLILELYKIYRKAKPDVILHYTVKPNIYGTIAAAFCGVPTVNNVCGLGTGFLKKGSVSLIVRILYKIAFLFPKKVFFQNEDDLSLFTDKKLVDHSITDLLPGSGIDLNKFKPESSSNNGDFTFLLISRLIKDKGIIEFIEAVKKLKEQNVKAKFKVLGAIDEKHSRGIQKKVIDSWIQEGVIEYLGTTDDVRTEIINSDCVVLPSYREGTPRTLLEAASSAKPIITTNTPGCKDIVDDGINGYLCKVKDADDLALQMKRMVSLSKEERIQMGMKGREKMENKYDEKIVIEKYLHSIKEIES